MGNVSAQLAQNALSLGRTALRSPTPPRLRGSEAASFARTSHWSSPTPRTAHMHLHNPASCASGRTTRRAQLARAFAQCNSNAQADCTSGTDGIRSNKTDAIELSQRSPENPNALVGWLSFSSPHCGELRINGTGSSVQNIATCGAITRQVPHLGLAVMDSNPCVSPQNCINGRHSVGRCANVHIIEERKKAFTFPKSRLRQPEHCVDPMRTTAASWGLPAHHLLPDLSRGSHLCRLPTSTGKGCRRTDERMALQVARRLSPRIIALRETKSNAPIHPRTRWSLLDPAPSKLATRERYIRNLLVDNAHWKGDLRHSTAGRLSSESTF